jgi:SAM-dependent methyltransferase
MHKRLQNCRGCGEAQLSVFLKLGPQPLANSFIRDAARFSSEPFFPLDVAFCRACALVQLVDEIDPEVLFRDYVYVSGTSETMTRHFAQYARDVVGSLKLGANDLVAELASNDGTLLAHAKAAGVRVLGIEPANNIAAMARERGIDTVAEFFNKELALQLRRERGGAAAIIANNVLAHVPNPRDFLAGAAEWLAPNGRVVTEFPYLEPMLTGMEYDTVYHEHMSYFSVTALLPLFASAGLTIQRIDHQPVHGGSLRVWSARKADVADHSAAVRALAAQEKQRGLADLARFEKYAEDVRAHRGALRELLEGLKRQGAVVAAHGAPAKGNTLLNHCGIDTSLVRYILDKNPLKVGSFSPGMHIPVMDPAHVAVDPPDYLLILAWNMAEEIMKQQSEFKARGGKFILPLPEPRIV